MKNSYILLRDNKESGALEIEELQKIGLKETDLIWVECQSWDWRSPREIPELKNLIGTTNNNNKINKSEETKTAYNRNQQEQKIYSQKKQNPDIKEFEKYSQPEISILSAYEKKEMNSQSNISSSALVITSTKNNYPEQIKQRDKNVFTNQLPGKVTTWALYAGLVLSGALLMFIIMKRENKQATVVQQKTLPPQNNVTPAVTISSVKNAEPVAPIDNVTNTELISKNSSDSVRKIHKTKEIALKTIPVVNKASADSQITTQNEAEKNVKLVTEIKSKPVSMAEISSKIILKANDYNVGFMGGVKNLTITLQNNSEYLLNKVDVKIDYLNSAGDIVNTDQVNFQSVKADDTKVLNVNKSKRGVKVKFYVTAIECKALASQQTAEPNSGNSSMN